MVEELSCHKAEEIAALAAKEPIQAGTDTIIIGSDTVVAADGVVLGKPADRADAIAMITDLQGRSHQVYTGVTLIRLRADGSRDRRIFHECTDVEVYPMTEQEIAAYADTEEPYDKAGAYGIQGAFGVRYVSGIRGDYYNVVGLPVPRLCQELKAMLG
jgi:septum formation protein